MLTYLRRHHAGLIALFVALGGTSYAAATVGSQDIQSRAVETRHLDRDAPNSDQDQLGQYHYPSIIQARDGSLHVTYSYFIPPARAAKDAEGRQVRKSIKHAHFNEAWVRAAGREGPGVRQWR